MTVGASLLANLRVRFASKLAPTKNKRQKQKRPRKAGVFVSGELSGVRGWRGR